MPYYDTIEEDLKRAREILEKGKGDPVIVPDPLNPEAPVAFPTGGTIYGADTYPAYRLLESFVEHIEADRRALQQIMQVLGPKSVCACMGCSWETNEALRIIRERGIEYQLRKKSEKGLPHDPAKEALGNETEPLILSKEDGKDLYAEGVQTGMEIGKALGTGTRIPEKKADDQ